MINAAKISSALLGIVGYKQPHNPTYAIVDAENQISRSGFFVTDNAFAKIEVLKDTQDYENISDANFNGVLRQMQKTSIINVCHQVFNEPDFIEREILYKNAFNKVQTETLPTGFVGYKIQVDQSKDFAVKINRVLLDFEGNGDIKLLLFNTSSREAIESKEVTIESDHQEVVLNWSIDNSGATYKGDYYLGYISNSLDVQPFKRDFNNASVMSQIEGLRIEKVIVSDHVVETLFDLNLVESSSQDCGLNLDISVFNDYTDFIIRNESFFARAIYLDCVIGFLLKYAATIRSNRTERLSEQLVSQAMLEVSGSEDSVIKIEGLRPQLKNEIQQIKNEILKIQRGFNPGMITVSTLV
jgi:hypothetical protein